MHASLVSSPGNCVGDIIERETYRDMMSIANVCRCRVNGHGLPFMFPLQLLTFMANRHEETHRGSRYNINAFAFPDVLILPPASHPTGLKKLRSQQVGRRHDPKRPRRGRPRELNPSPPRPPPCPPSPPTLCACRRPTHQCLHAWEQQ